MSTDSSFVRQLREVGEGRREATEQVFREFFPRLVRFAQARIARRYHARADPEGVANSVLKSFFRRHAGAGYDQLTDAEQLWRLLAEIAACKCSNRVRKFTRPAEDGRRDRQEALAEDGKLLADCVRPEDDVIAADLIDELTADWSAKERLVIDMSLDGREVLEIAAAVQQSDRTVKRIRAQFKRRLEATLRAVDAAA